MDLLTHKKSVHRFYDPGILHQQCTNQNKNKKLSTKKVTTFNYLL